MSIGHKGRRTDLNAQELIEPIICVETLCLALQLEFWRHAKACWDQEAWDVHPETPDISNFFEYEAEGYLLMWLGLPVEEAWCFHDCRTFRVLS